MRGTTALAALAAILAAGVALADIELPSAAKVDQARLLAADDEPEQWLLPGRGYSEQRYSPLSQINDQNVGGLGLAWYGDYDTRRAQESTPLVIDGVLYVTTAWSKVYAYDARTGRQLWKYDPKVPGEWGVNTCCDVVNRGLAAWKGKVYLGTLDGRLIAIDAATGNEVWSTQTTPKDQAYSITGAPRVADGKVFIGQAGSEFAQRGFMAAYDAQTGRQLWKWWAVPGDPREGFEQPELKRAAATWKGEWWKAGGGGSPWDGIAYDPRTHRLIFGTGNGAPWPQSIRSPGSLKHNENLFLSSMVALDADTGRYVWHYQMTPNESWDFDATQQITLADLRIGGRTRRVAMQANKNGMFYVVDVRTGRLLSGRSFVPDINWHLGLDRKGRPRINPDAVYTEERGFVVSPGFGGAHSWHPMSYSPATGLVYIPAMYGSHPLVAAREDDNPMGQKLSVNMGKALTTFGAPPAGSAYLLAWDPIAGKEVWRASFEAGRGGGTLATAGNLVFQGNSKEFAAYRADNGEKLWSMPTQTGVIAGAITYQIDGEQYIAVSAGDDFVTNYYSANGSRLLVFKLGGTARLPDPPPPVQQVLDPPEAFGSAELLARGADRYGRFCGTCHGNGGQGRGTFPDLRYSAMLGSPAAFNAVVLEGALTESGMVSFRQALQEEDVDAIRAYMISRALDLQQQLSSETASQPPP